MRLPNALMAAVGVLVGAWLLGPDAVALTTTVPAAVAALCITSFGNVINDIQDVELDRVAHPLRPLPSSLISIPQAKWFAGLLLAFGLWEAAIAAGQPTFWFAVANATILVAYEWRLKRLGLAGNVTVALLVASTFLFGAVSTGVAWRAWGLVASLAAMAFLANVARELLKDVQDAHADVTSRSTLATELGAGTARLLAFFLIQVAIALSVVTWLGASWSAWWGIPLLLADMIFVASAAAAWRDIGLAQQGLKVGMLVAMVAFGLGPTL